MSDLLENIVNNVYEKFFDKIDRVRACFRRIRSLSPFPLSLRAIIFDPGSER
jgi:hypothetical protein